MDTSDIRSHRLTTVQSEGHSQTHAPQATPVHRWSNDDRMPGGGMMNEGFVWVMFITICADDDVYVLDHSLH